MVWAHFVVTQQGLPFKDQPSTFLPSHVSCSLFFLDFPQLPPLEQAVNNNNQPRQQEPNGEWGDVSAKGKKFKRTSGPRSIDPYASDESWFWPITIAIAIFLPVMFCLCGLS